MSSFISALVAVRSVPNPRGSPVGDSGPPSPDWCAAALVTTPAYAERVIGSIRRECLDHVIVLSEASLRRTMTSYLAYYEQSRTHLSLNKDAPIPREIAMPSEG